MRGFVFGLLVFIVVAGGALAFLAVSDIKPAQQKVEQSVPDQMLPR